jgi:pimeloyl-ACP methyl ester carboxylesterase
MPEEEGRTLNLKDGRKLGYAVYGQPDGKPVFHFHGNPSSRLETKIFHESANKYHACIIGIDRPGIGLSDYKPGRKLLDWPNDVVELAGKLGYKRFSIIGGSGGGSAVLACAYKIPDKLVSAGVYATPRPLDEPGATRGWGWLMRLVAFMGRNCPLWMTELSLKPYADMLRGDTAKALSKMAEQLPPPDRKAFEQGEVRQILGSGIKEAFISGTRGFALDYMLSMKSWGFSLEKIQMEVYLWQGEQDSTIPAAMGHYLAGAIPHCKATFFKDDGHFSLLANRTDEMLSTLLGET